MQGTADGDEGAKGAAVEVQQLPKIAERHHRAATAVPNPISGVEMERYRRYLGLSEEQVVFLRHIYDEYAVKWNSLVDEKWAEVDRLEAASTWFLVNGQANWSSVDSYDAWVEEEDRFRDAAIRNEEELFAKMEAVLTEGQREMMWRVRADRQRIRPVFMMWVIRSTWLDFSRYVQEELGLTAAELVPIDPVLIEYEQEVSELREGICEELLRNRKEMHRLTIEMTWGPRDKPDGVNDMGFRNRAGATLLNERAELSGMLLELAEIQSKYLPLLMEKLPSSRAELLLTKQRETAWPEAYPDHTDPAEAYKSVVANGSLDEDERTYLEGLWQTYRAGYDRICTEMCDRQDDKGKSMAKEGGYDQQEYRSAMQRLTEQRWEANMRMLQAMMKMAGDRDKASRSLILTRINSIETYQKWEKGGEQPVGRPKGGG